MATISMRLQATERGGGNGQSTGATLLSKIEMRILAQMVGGATDRQIAETLSISSRTAETHIRGICKRINAPNRLQAVLWAVKNL